MNLIVLKGIKFYGSNVDGLIEVYNDKLKEKNIP